MAKEAKEPDRLEVGKELEPDPGDVEQMDIAFEEATAPKDKGKAKPAEKAAPPPSDGDGEADPPPDGDDDKEKADPPPDGEGKDEGDGKPPPPPDSDSPKARLADLEKRYQDGDGKPADPPPPPPPPPSPAEKPASGSLEEQVQSALSNLGDELTFGDGKVDAKGFREDFGEEATFVCAVAAKATAPLIKEIAKLREDLAEVSYWSALEGAHPGARRLADDPEFKAWLSSQPEAIRRASVGSNPADAITIVDAYKATLKSGAVRTAKEGAAASKARRDSLHLGTLRGGVAAKAGAAADNKEDFDAAFDEATKKD